MSRAAQFKFCLYVADDAPNSTRAVTNLTEFCRLHLPHRHAIEIVDVLRHPQRALADGILMTPTLVKLSPLPVRRVVGTLSEPDVLLLALGLAPLAA